MVTGYEHVRSRGCLSSIKLVERTNIFVQVSTMPYALSMSSYEHSYSFWFGTSNGNSFHLNVLLN